MCKVLVLTLLCEKMEDLLSGLDGGVGMTESVRSRYIPGSVSS